MPNVNTVNAAPFTPADISSLWWLWKHPDAGRHYKLAETDNQLVTTAAALIRTGHAAMVAAALADPVLGDLFAVVDGLRPASAETLRRVYEQPPPRFADADADVDQLVDDLFSGVDPGLGIWPTPPAHSCVVGKSVGTAITINPSVGRVSAAPMINSDWRRGPTGGRCDGCYHDRVQRTARQVAYEADRHPLTWVLLPLAGPNETAAAPLAKWAGRQRAIRQRGGAAVRYCALPQPDGTTIVLSTSANGEPVGRDRATIYRLLWGWMETPEGREQSGTRGWGGPWQGVQGDGRRRAAARAKRQQDKEQHAGRCLCCDAELPPGRVYCDAECRTTYDKKQRKAAGVLQRRTGKTVRSIAAALGKKLNSTQRQFSMGVDPVDAVAALLRAGIAQDTHAIGDDKDQQRAWAELVADAQRTIVDVDDNASAEGDTTAEGDTVRILHIDIDPLCVRSVLTPNGHRLRCRKKRRPGAPAAQGQRGVLCSL